MSIVNGVKARRKDFGALLKLGIGLVFDLFFVNFFRNSDNNSNKVLAVILGVLFFLLVISGIKTRFRLKKVFLIGSAVASAQISEIKLSSLAEAIGVKEKYLQKLFKKYLKKKIFQNCELSEESEPRLILTVSEQEAGEVELQCPSCGKVFKASAGSVARCPECASVINM